MPVFESRDPSAPAFWSERFEQHYMPWDRAGVPEALQRFVAQAPRKLTTLIPGCGMGYEVAFLSAAGWDVTAIDFSPSAVASAQAALGSWSDRIVQADFFTFVPEKPPDLIYERAFLCALPRDKWPQIALRWAELLAPGSLLAGYFYFDAGPKGPPFGIESAQLDDLLTPYFGRVEDSPVTDSVAVFAGKERWQIWRRLDGGN